MQACRTVWVAAHRGYGSFKSFARCSCSEGWCWKTSTRGRKIRKSRTFRVQHNFAYFSCSAAGWWHLCCSWYFANSDLTLAPSHVGNLSRTSNSLLFALVATAAGWTFWSHKFWVCSSCCGFLWALNVPFWNEDLGLGWHCSGQGNWPSRLKKTCVCTISHGDPVSTWDLRPQWVSYEVRGKQFQSWGNQRL